MSPSGGAMPPSSPTTSAPPTTDTSPPAQAPAPPSTPSTPPTASEPASPSQQTAPSAQGSSAPASATAPGAASAPATYTVGESVKDNTGAAIGSITSLTGSGANQMAVIKMGDQSFQVQTSRLGSADGAAEINMTKAQITGMLHSSSK
jgi:hypothetical protein